jgi:hypothetical protein
MDHINETELRAIGQYWQQVDPEKRRKIVLESRKNWLEQNKKVKPVLLIMEIPFLITLLFNLAVNILNGRYFISIAGFLSGVAFATLEVAIINTYKTKSITKILADDFSDADALEYLQESDKISFRFIRRSKLGIMLSTVNLGMILLLVSFATIRQFGSIFLTTTGSTLFLELFWLFERLTQKRKIFLH